MGQDASGAPQAKEGEPCYEQDVPRKVSALAVRFSVVRYASVVGGCTRATYAVWQEANLKPGEFVLQVVYHKQPSLTTQPDMRWCCRARGVPQAC